ncbi:MAG: CAP domain-containing protein [Bacteroidota bacterium]
MCCFSTSAQHNPSFDLLKLVNDLRAEGCYCNGIYQAPTGSVEWNATLEKSARVHASDMERNNFFSHYSRNGKDIGDRLDAIGYDWKVVGENIAQGYYKAPEVLQAWIDSPEHCELLMNPKFKEMGASLVGEYWVQHFGTRRTK